MNEFNNIMYYRYYTYVYVWQSIYSLLFICICTCVCVYVYIGIKLLSLHKKKFVFNPFLRSFFFVQTPNVYVTRKREREREKKSVRNMCVKWCTIDLSSGVNRGDLTRVVHFFFYFFSSLLSSTSFTIADR